METVIDAAFPVAPSGLSTLACSVTHGLRRGLHAVVPAGTGGWWLTRLLFAAVASRLQRRWGGWKN